MFLRTEIAGERPFLGIWWMEQGVLLESRCCIKRYLITLYQIFAGREAWLQGSLFKVLIHQTKVIPVRSLRWSKEMLYGRFVQALDMKFSLFCVIVPLIKIFFPWLNTACRMKNACARRSGQQFVFSVFLLDVMSMEHEITCAQRLTLSWGISNEHYLQSVSSLWIICHLHTHY